MDFVVAAAALPAVSQQKFVSGTARFGNDNVGDERVDDGRIASNLWMINANLRCRGQCINDWLGAITAVTVDYSCGTVSGETMERTR